MTIAEEIMTIEDQFELYDTCDRLSVDEVVDNGLVYYKFKDESFICLKEKA